MKYAFLSDIHANLQALEAVLADCRLNKIDHIICLGDCVGYGPEPQTVLQRIRGVARAILQGNHDAAACETLDMESFTPFAQTSVNRARLSLNDEELSFLKDLPLILEGDGFACTHGTFAIPQAFYYMTEKKEAERSFREMKDFSLLFVGHTHVPWIFERSKNGSILESEPKTFTLKADSRYLINVGSVGLPRDANHKSCYVIYDTEEKTISFRRIQFDINAFLQNVIRKGFNPDNYWFLSGDIAVNEKMAFTPVSDIIYQKGNVKSQILAPDFSPKKEPSKFNFFSIFIGMVITGIFICAIMVIVKILDFETSPQPPVTQPPSKIEIVSNEETVKAISILPHIPLLKNDDGSYENWEITGGAKVTTFTRGLSRGFAIASEEEQNIMILSARIPTGKFRSFRCKMKTKILEASSGKLTVSLLQYKKEPSGEISPSGTSKKISITIKGKGADRDFELKVRENCEFIQFCITGSFSGSMEFGNLELLQEEKGK